MLGECRKKDKSISYKPMMLMMPRDKDEIVTLVGYDANAPLPPTPLPETLEEDEDEFNLDSLVSPPATCALRRVIDML